MAKIGIAVLLVMIVTVIQALTSFMTEEQWRTWLIACIIGLPLIALWGFYKN